MKLPPVVTTIWIFAAILFAAPPAGACTCVGPLDTCAVLASSAVVLEATVESIEATTASMNMVPGSPSFAVRSHRVRLRDVKTWRGSAPAFVITPADGAACGYEFRVGTRYLIAGERASEGRLEVHRCGLTRPLAESKGLIDYLALAAASERVRIRVWGQVTRAVRWVDFAREFTGVPAARVAFDGPTPLSVQTDAAGRFVVDDLRPGRYRITVAPPATIPELGPIHSSEFEIGTGAAAACRELDFVAPIKSSLSGVVLDETGRPLSGVFVTLRLPDQRDLSRGAAGAGFTTDTQGRYEFRDLPPGRYAVALSPLGRRSDQLLEERIVILRFGERVTLDPLVVRRFEPMESIRRWTHGTR